MNYKEIQVPSSTVREVFEPILEKLLAVADQAQEKYDLKVKRKRDWAKKESIRSDLAYKNYPKAWLHHSTMSVYKRTDWYFTKNRVKDLIEICSNNLEATTLAEFLVMTEDQVQEFTKHKEGKSLKDALDWLNTDKPYVEPESDYPEWMMTPPKPKVTEIEKKEATKPAEVTEAPKLKEVESHFWKAFFVISAFIALILVLAF